MILGFFIRTFSVYQKWFYCAHYNAFHPFSQSSYWTKYSRMDQAKFVKNWSKMVYFNRPYQFDFFKGFTPQIFTWSIRECFVSYDTTSKMI